MQDFTEEIGNALDLLYKLEKISEKKKLFDKGRTVYLRIVLFKIPLAPPRQRKYLKLCHSLHGDNPEICLFVPNRKTEFKLKRTADDYIDFCIDYYTEFLEKHKVKGISACMREVFTWFNCFFQSPIKGFYEFYAVGQMQCEIELLLIKEENVMPLKQLRCEYGTYELKRKLASRFDLFLCKTSLLYNPKFLSSLGKTFLVAKKQPLGVSFPKENADYDPEFQKSIEKAIFTTSFYINPFSDNYSIPFGSLSNTKEELKENLEAVLNQIFSENLIPGGFKNIRTMHLWPSQSKPIPLYFSKELPDDLEQPDIKSNRKRPLGVEGELSTQPGKKVFVMPNGDVFVTKLNKNETVQEDSSESEDSFEDESDYNDDEREEEEKERKNKSSTEFKNPTANEEESESEDDEEIEKKEAELLLKYSKK